MAFKLPLKSELVSGGVLTTEHLNDIVDSAQANHNDSVAGQNLIGTARTEINAATDTFKDEIAANLKTVTDVPILELLKVRIASTDLRFSGRHTTATGIQSTTSELVLHSITNFLLILIFMATQETRDVERPKCISFQTPESNLSFSRVSYSTKDSDSNLAKSALIYGCLFEAFKRDLDYHILTRAPMFIPNGPIWATRGSNLKLYVDASNYFALTYNHDP